MTDPNPDWPDLFPFELAYGDGPAMIVPVENRIPRRRKGRGGDGPAVGAVGSPDAVGSDVATSE